MAQNTTKLGNFPKRYDIFASTVKGTVFDFGYCTVRTLILTYITANYPGQP